ncbi:MAG TPA: phosphate regulon sensor histidine kinase PhoR [Gammaproteobacteria bacterium]|nr:phosphate regulon sensor histidine kinase PhoR [Gammaproteobacteria bacterium]
MNPWPGEVIRITLVLLAGLIVGWLTGHILAFLLLAVAGLLGWHLFHLRRLELWLRKGARHEPPQGHGVWGEVYYHFYRLRERANRRKRRLASVISRFRESTAALPDATIVMSASGEIEWFNDAARSLLGLRAPQDVGQRINNLLRHPRFTRYFAHGHYPDSIELPSPVNEQQTLSLTIIPYGQDQRLLVARDVTRIKHLEQIRSDFIANVSHELRTPLTVVGGYLETMLDADDECTDQWQRPLALMKQHNLRMQHLVEDLLLLSRLETEFDSTVQHRPVPIAPLLNNLYHSAQTLSGPQQHDIQLSTDQACNLMGDEKELYSAFSNLVSNAIRYTPEGGRIDIRWYCDDQGGHFEVSDTGIGIPSQHIDRLTERFYRVDAGRSRESGGTGLGLAIVKHVLERHHAHLHIRSQPGTGSTFRCDFPPQALC